MDKTLFDKIWKEAGDVFDGVQVIESKVINRPVRYYAFPYRDGVPNHKIFIKINFPALLYCISPLTQRA